MDQQPLEALKKDPHGFCLKDSPMCPHCGHECRLSDNDWWALCREDEHEKTCPSCGLDFKIQTRATYYFSTDEQDA
jgi:hypothetical protein